MSFTDAITSNWPYKVAAVSLSVLLWLNVTADQERVDQPISTRVEFEVRDSLWSIRDAPTEVRTIFTGRRGDIIALFDQPVIRRVIDTVDDSIIEVTLDVDDVEFDRDRDFSAATRSAHGTASRPDGPGGAGQRCDGRGRLRHRANDRRAR